MAALSDGLVGILPAGGGPEAAPVSDGLDPTAHAEGFLAKMARAAGPAARAPETRGYGPGRQVASAGVGAWRMARSPVLHWALSNQQLRRYGFLVPTDLAG